MTHQHDHAHDAATASPAVATDSELAPGRGSRTAGLVGPTGPRPSGLLMRKRDGNHVAHDAESAVGAASNSTGSALPDDLRSRFEGSLGTDLSSVRVHTGAASVEAASAVGAKAYTLGNDIHFGAGHFDTASLQGQHLLAHEVAHTVQQRGGSPTRQNKLEVSSPGDAFEHEADRAANAMVSGATVTIAGASIGLARTTKEGEKEKKKYPSWKDESASIPIAPKLGGNLKFSWGENPGADISLKKEAKAELFKAEYTQSIQIAPGITGSITGEIKGKLGASASATAAGHWMKTAGEDEESLQLSLTGKGAVEFSASGSLQLSAGVGLANVLALEGGIKGEITAKTTGDVHLGGTITRKPDGSQTGTINFGVGLEAALEAASSLVVDVVVPGDRINVYEKELGKLEIGTAGVVCDAVYANGKVTDLPPKITAKWLPVPPLEARATRKLTDAERRSYAPNPVDQGASGGRPDGTPDEIALTDQELFDQGKKDALARLVAVNGATLPVINGAGLFGSMLVDGGAVRAMASIDLQRRQRDEASGREIVKVTAGQVIGWSQVNSPSVDLVKDCAKTPSAVCRAYLAKHIELTVIGTDFEYKEVPPKMGVCKKDEGTGPFGS